MVLVIPFVCNLVVVNWLLTPLRGYHPSSGTYQVWSFYYGLLDHYWYGYLVHVIVVLMVMVIAGMIVVMIVVVMMITDC